MRYLFLLLLPFFIQAQTYQIERAATPWNPPILTSPGTVVGQTGTLNGGITNVATTYALNTPFTVAPPGKFVVQIDSERILCTSYSAGTCSTAVRAIDSTSAASHSNGATVTLLRWRTLAAPTVDYDTGNAIYFHRATTAATWQSTGIVTSLPASGAWNVVATFRFSQPTSGVGWDGNGGFWLRNDTDAKAKTCGFAQGAGGGLAYITNANYWTNLTTIGGAPGNSTPISLAPSTPRAVYKIAFDGSGSFRCYASIDGGVTWDVTYLETYTTNFTPTTVGMYVAGYNASVAGQLDMIVTGWNPSWTMPQ